MCGYYKNLTYSNENKLTHNGFKNRLAHSEYKEKLSQYQQCLLYIISKYWLLKRKQKGSFGKKYTATNNQ